MCPLHINRFITKYIDSYFYVAFGHEGKDYDMIMRTKCDRLSISYLLIDRILDITTDTTIKMKMKCIKIYIKKVK